MQAVVTDGYTLNPGDLDWKKLEDPRLSFRFYDRSPAETVVDRCREADIIVSNKVIFSKEVLDQLPRLKMISVLATGHNVIDGVAARERGIVVCNVPAYGTASVAQHAIALMLAFTNRVQEHAASVSAGDWVRNPDWCYTISPLTELEGKTFGVVGWGNIGRRTASIAAALGMKILYYSPRPAESKLGQFASLEDLFAHSDVLSLHCPLTADNREFVNKHLLRRMKPTAILINTARGQLIREQDLAEALQAGTLAGAALDVLSSEPPDPNNPLLKAPHCLITPHNAWISVEARQRILEITARNLRAFLDGKPIHVVNS